MNYKLMMTVITVCILSLTLFGRTSAQTEGDETLELVSVFGGTVNNIVTDGDYAYMDESGNRITIFDATDPANLTTVSTSGRLTRDVEEMELVGDLLYIANSWAGLTVMNVSDKTNPVVVGTAETYRGEAGAVSLTIVGNYAYVVQRTSDYVEWQGLVIYDVTDPTAPVVAGVLEMPKGLYDTLYQVEVSGNHAFVSSRDKGFVSIDVTDPAAPTEITNVEIEYGTYHFVLNGNYAHVISRGSYDVSLNTLDISDPTNIMTIGSINVSEEGNASSINAGDKLYFDGQYAYLRADRDENRLFVFDISNPTSPTIVDTLPIGVTDMAFGGDYAYTVNGNVGASIWDFSTVPDVNLVDDYQGTSATMYHDSPRNVVVEDNIAYIATDLVGLTTVDVSDAENPVVLGSDPGIYSQHSAGIVKSQIIVKNGTAYIRHFYGVRIYDVTDPTMPTELSYQSVQVRGLGTSGMALYQNYLYVTDYGYITILDVSDPANPYPVNVYSINNEGPFDSLISAFIEIIGGYAYVGVDRGLRIFDLTTPIQPVEIGTVDNAYEYAWAGETSTDKGFLYIVSGERITIIDVTDPSTAQLSGQILNNGLGIEKVAVVNGFAYVAGDNGIAVVDVTDPTSPVEISRDTSVNNMNSVDIANGHIVFTSRQGELFTYLPNPEYGLSQLAQCEEAPMVMSDGTVRTGNFAAENELDWLRFDVEEGKTYRVVVETPAGSATDVAADVYPSCNTAVEIQQSYPFAPGVRFNFTPSSTGTYVMGLYNEDGSQFGDDVNYTVSIEELNSSTPEGAVIIVAGRDQLDDTLQPNIHNVTNNVYRLFSQYGYTADSLHYLATDSDLDPMQNGSLSAAVREVDGSATLANLEYAITTWARDKVGANGVATGALTLYLMSHGLSNNFALDIPNSERLTPEQLDTWLDTLEESYPDLKVNIIIDACYSGSFIDPADSVSVDESDRVVISSAGSQELAWASAEGANFSDYFLTSLRQRLSLKQAFDVASAAVLSSPNPQTPWLDDNGNGLPNETGVDGQIASTRGFNYTGSLFSELWEPYVRNVATSGNESGRVTISAEILDDFGVGAAWAVVYPPSYTPPVGDDGRLVSEELATVPLELDADNRYTATVDLVESGDYTFVVYAQDEDGLISRPVPIDISNGIPTTLAIALIQSNINSESSSWFVVTGLISLIASSTMLFWSQKQG